MRVWLALVVLVASGCDLGPACVGANCGKIPKARPESKEIPFIPRGMRAATITITDASADFVTAGRRVDVLGTTRRRGLIDTHLVLEAVNVLAIERRGPKRLVTVAVLPGQAEELVLAQQTGTLSLALRNDRDVRAAGTYDEPEPVAEQPEPPHRPLP